MRRHRPNRIAAIRMAGHESQTPERAGAVYLEFILIFPLVFFATLAIFQFGLLSLALQSATTALIEGTRTGAAYYPSGTTTSDIADAVASRVNQFLAVHGLSVGGSGGTAQIRMERGLAPSVMRGTLPGGFTMGAASGPPPDSTEIRVTLCFPLVSTTDPHGVGDPVPDWLNWIGFSMATMKFEMSSRASLE